MPVKSRLFPALIALFAVSFANAAERPAPHASGQKPPWLEGDCTKRMVRGGTWNWSADKSRAGHRGDSWFGTGNSVRVVRTLNV
jgi:hypothetical protein